MGKRIKNVDGVEVEMTQEEIQKELTEKAAFKAIWDQVQAIEADKAAELATAEQKAVASVIEVIDLSSIKDLPPDLLTYIKGLEARIEYLEKVGNIDHSAKGKQ